MVVYASSFFLFFGLLTLLGGVQAFLTAHSKASLIAGSLCGLALILAGWLARGPQPGAGLILGLVVNLALAGQFLPKFFKTGKWWPAGVEGWLGLVGLALAIAALAGK